MRTAPKLALTTAALLGLFASAALAVPAETTGAAKLRSGPGPGYRVVASLPPRATLNVGQCVGAWCPATWRGIAGYVGLGSLVATRPPTAGPFADGWDTDGPQDNWVRVRRNGEWVWVPPALDSRKARDDRNHDRNRNARNDRDDGRRAAASRRDDGGGDIWVPPGREGSGMSSAGRDGGRDGGGRDGGGRDGGDGGGRGGDGGGGDGGGRGR